MKPTTGATMIAGTIAIDTNVLIYAMNEDDPHHPWSSRFVRAVAKGSVPACVFPQNLLEFYAIVTDARRVAHPLTPTEAMAEISKLRAIIPVIGPGEGALDLLVSLTSPAGPKGADVYDAFIVAQMQDAGTGFICTYNLRDFEGFPVNAGTPEEMMAVLGISQDGSGLVHDRPVHR